LYGRCIGWGEVIQTQQVESLVCSDHEIWLGFIFDNFWQEENYRQKTVLPTQLEKKKLNQQREGERWPVLPENK